MVSSERAWVLIDRFEEPPLSSGIEWPEVLEPAFAGRPIGVVHYKISGKTPAKIVGIHVRFHLVSKKSDASEPDLPDEPVYQADSGIVRDLDAAFVKAPGQELTLSVLFEGQYITRTELAEIREGNLFPCVYGRIKYWSFDLERETRFCWIYQVVPGGGPVDHKTREPLFQSGFREGGPRAYIRHT